MHRFIPFVLGFGAASAIFLLIVLPKERRDAREYGRYIGGVSARLEFRDKLAKALGDDYRDEEDGYRVFAEVKDSPIVVVERNGVKTLRVYHASGRGGPQP